MRRPRIVVVMALAAVVGSAAVPAVPAHAAGLPDGACEYVTAISDPDGLLANGLAEVAVPGSDAAAYGVFENDLRAASVAAEHNVRRSVRCGPKMVEVDLYQYGLPIKPPKLITTVYDRFVVDADGRVETFSVNGTPIAGRVLVGAQPPAVALGATVTLSSAYRVPPKGGETIKTKNALLVAITATAPSDGVRDVATGATSYQTADDEYLSMRTVGQGSPLQPGASSTWVMEFDVRKFGGTLTVPVVAGSAFQPSPDAPLEAARLLVAPADG